MSRLILSRNIEDGNGRAGASKGLHAILSGVNFTASSSSSSSSSYSSSSGRAGAGAGEGGGGGGTVFFESLDAAVVRWDRPAPFPTPLHTQPDLSFGASFLLFGESARISLASEYVSGDGTSDRLTI
jgi:hypothetical protein